MSASSSTMSSSAMKRRRLCLASGELAVLVLVLLTGGAAADGCVEVGFYDETCPSAESLVRQTVAAAFANNSGVAPALIRLHFHDCFVKGCDGSVLIDSTAGNAAEKDAPPNNPSLRFFEVVDSAKAAAEARCPGVVSCADILAFAARDAVVLSGGLGYEVPAGRRDGRVSSFQDALDNLPGPTSNASQLAAAFAAKKLSVEDIVVLSGAHTVGVSHCDSFTERLYNFPNTTDGVDPALSKAYAFLLRSVCPATSNQTFPTTTPSMDLLTPARFDNRYYVGLVNNLGLFQSDAALLADAAMGALVHSFVRSEAAFRASFARSMVKMGLVDLLSGTQGEIRHNCRVVNPGGGGGATAAAYIAGGTSPAGGSSPEAFAQVAAS